VDSVEKIMGFRTWHVNNLNWTCWIMSSAFV